MTMSVTGKGPDATPVRAFVCVNGRLLRQQYASCPKCTVAIFVLMSQQLITQFAIPASFDSESESSRALQFFVAFAMKGRAVCAALGVAICLDVFCMLHDRCIIREAMVEDDSTLLEKLLSR